MILTLDNRPGKSSAESHVPEGGAKPGVWHMSHVMLGSEMHHQLFAQTPHQYLTARRLQHAARLLRQPETSVTEICFAAGFESLGAFSTLFRRHTGLSPDAYRRPKRLK